MEIHYPLLNTNPTFSFPQILDTPSTFLSLWMWLLLHFYINLKVTWSWKSNLTTLVKNPEKAITNCKLLSNAGAGLDYQSSLSRALFTECMLQRKHLDILTQFTNMEIWKPNSIPGMYILIVIFESKTFHTANKILRGKSRIQKYTYRKITSAKTCICRLRTGVSMKNKTRWGFRGEILGHPSF